MNRYLIIVLMAIFLLSPCSSVVSLLTVSNMEDSQLTTAEGGGIGSSEEENIDSFNVHPLNRWTEVTNIGTAVTVEDGVLNITDTGDGSVDYVRYERALRDLDGKVEIRFRVKNSATSGDNDRFIIGLFTSSGFDFTTIAELRIRAKNVSQIYANSFLGYFDVEGVEQTYDLDTSEVIWNNYWYILTIKYNLLESELSWKLKFANGTEVFDVDILDISDDSDHLAKLFQGETIHVGIEGRTTTNFVDAEYNIDYIKAPFKEREWEVKTESVDAQWLEKSWNFAYGSGDVDTEISNYSLIVPYLDLVSGELRASSTTGAIPTNNWMYTDFLLYGVDSDDGEIHELIGATVGIFDIGSGDFVTCYIGSGVGWTTSLYQKSIAYTGVEKPLVRFAMASIEDRDAIQFKMRFFPDEKVDTVFYDFVREVDSSSYSSEFLLETKYWINIDAGEDATLSVTNLDILERNIWDGIGNFIDGVIGAGQEALGGGADIFTALFRWLGGILSAAFALVGDSLGVIFVAVGVAIVAALSPIATSLSTLASDIWSGIGNALDFLTTAIGLVTTAVEAIASDVATAVWSGIGSALDFITTAISGIAAAIWVAVLAVASDLADLVVDIIDFLIGLAGNIISAIWDFITTASFFLWDALGLPDLLAIVDLFLVAFVELVNATPTFINQVVPAILAMVNLGAIIGVVFLLIVPAISSNSVGEFIEKFIEYFFKDTTMGASLLGFQIPVPIGALWMLTVIATVLSSTIFGGFF